MAKNKKHDDVAPVLLSLIDCGSRMLVAVEIAVSAWLGSWNCIAVHTILFVAWFAVEHNTDKIFMFISFEGVYLVIILLMSGNRAERKSKEEEFERYKATYKMIHFSNKTDAAVKEMAENLTRTTDEITGKLKSIENRLSNIEKRKGLLL